MISVITATYNAGEYLPGLIKSLQAQTDKDFEWVVADGGSTDNTLSLLADAKDLNIKISSHADFGIYDALNRGLKIATGAYYVAAGADDRFFDEAIASFRQTLQANPKADFVVANVQVGERLVKPTGRVWLNGLKGCVAAHSIGTLIKKQLHEEIGYYSRLFPIAADELFILQAAKANYQFIHTESVVGFHAITGVSGVDVAGSLLETFRVKLRVGENKYLQLMLLFLKMIKSIRRY